MKGPKVGQPHQPPKDQDGLDVGHGRAERGHPPLSVVTTLVGAGMGAVVAIVLLSAWRDMGPVAATAITAISAMIGAAIGVAGLEVRRRSR